MTEGNPMKPRRPLLNPNVDGPAVVPFPRYQLGWSQVVSGMKVTAAVNRCAAVFFRLAIPPLIKTLGLNPEILQEGR